jgi:hypothetical protein
VLAAKGCSASGWNDELVNKPELDELRCYVRLGSPKSVWPIHIRRIYPADFHFTDIEHGPHQLLHEFTLLCVPQSQSSQLAEFYAVVAIFGIEYVINLGGPEIDGFGNWLASHGDRSPLYDQLS